MEIDEHLEYTLYANAPPVASLPSDCLSVPVCCCSLQFDPAPRRGEPHVTRRTPDYFL